MVEQGTKNAINIGIAIVVAALVFALLGGSTLTLLSALASGGKTSTGDYNMEKLCAYLKDGVAYVRFNKQGDGVSLDSFLKNLVNCDCFEEDERREIRAGGGPIVTAVATCPAGDEEGLNFYMLGPTETHYIWSGRSYMIGIEAVGGGTYPDGCVTIEEIS